MRLDVYLKLSRLVPRRSLAQEFCDAGLVEVNCAVAKSSKEVKVDDEIEIKRRSRRTKVRVAQVPSSKNVSKQSAGELYELIEETKVDDEPWSI